MQQDIHQSFKEHVRRRRAGKIDEADETLFTGDVVTGRMALQRGLIDGIGELRAVMRARYGDKVRLRAGRRRAAPLAVPEPPAVCRARARLADRRVRRLDRGAPAVGQVRLVSAALPRRFLTRLPGCR